MFAIFTVLLVIALSILVTRIATVALIHTGLSREAARFQARSAFTGAGFTTSEAEQVVGHPVRRRIIMLLMLLGNAGIVTVIGSLILGFTVGGEAGFGFWTRLALLAGGVAILLALANSALIDHWLSAVITRALKRWTKLDVRDYAGLLHLSGEYGVRELQVRSGDSMEGQTLGELRLRDEGLNVLGIERRDGSYVGAPRGETQIEAGDTVIIYGRETALAALDERRKGWRAAHEHERAVAEQRRVEQEQRLEETDRFQERRREIDQSDSEQPKGSQSRSVP